MKLSNNVLIALTGKKSSKLKAKLALGLGCSMYTISRWIKVNEDNGDLTKSAAVQIIKEETGLSEDEILSCVAIAE